VSARRPASTPAVLLRTTPPLPLPCSRVADTLPAGRVNVSFRVDSASSGYGQAVFGRNGWQVTLDGTGALYQYMAHPTIYGLSFGAIGLGGGTPLVISGAGFSSTPAANQVLLAGVPCSVTQASATSLTCIPGAAASATPAFVNGPGVLWNATSSPVAYRGATWLGGRGMLHRVWNGVSDVSRMPSLAPSIEQINTDSVFGYSFNQLDNYMEEFTGFFVPPVTANYSFYVRGDDHHVSATLSPGVGDPYTPRTLLLLLLPLLLQEFYLSTDSSPANLTRIAYTGYAATFFDSSTQISRPLLLRAGQAYFTRVLHREGGGGDYFDSGVRISSNDGPIANFSSETQRVYRSTPEVQRITLNTIVIREVQVR
jgi:hypothetical protein